MTTLLAPSGDPIELYVSIRVSGPGVEEASERFHVDEELSEELLDELSDLFSRLCGWVPVSGVLLGLHFDPTE